MFNRESGDYSRAGQEFKQMRLRCVLAMAGQFGSTLPRLIAPSTEPVSYTHL